MKIKTEIVLMNFNGDVLQDNDGKGNLTDANLKHAIVNSLLAPLQQGKNETGVEKVKKYELAKRVYDNDEVELSAEEVSLIKERLAEVYPPLVVGQCFKILEGNTE